jgi:hypothetical protein
MSARLSIYRRCIAGVASVLLIAGSVPSAFAVNPIDFFPLGGLGGRANYTRGSNLLNVTEVYATGPAAAAGLRVGDFIYAVNGKSLPAVSANSSDGWRGGVAELGNAIELAESSTGALSLGVLRPGTGPLTLNATLSLNSAWRPSYPSGDSRANAMFEKSCADLHSSIQASSYIDYSSGWYGMIMLASPNWNDTSGTKPYRNSINKLRDDSLNYLNSCILEPVEPGNPAYVGVGLENWAITTNCMFIGEYRRKTGDTSVDAAVQRCALLLANRIQCYNQSDDGGTLYTWKHGIMGHGGVTGDYAHLWLTGLNIINAHATVAMGILKGAGADFSAIAGSSGLTINQKFLTNWAWLKTCTRTDGWDDDGCVGYQGVESGWDAAARTAGAAAGYQIYLNAGGTAATADDLDKLARQKAYVARHGQRQQNCHAYSGGGIALSQAVLPFMDDRSQRYFMENTRFLYTLSRDQTGGIQYFPGRENNTGDGYLGTNGVKYYMSGLFQAMGTGNLPSFPAPSPTRAFVRMSSPLNDWPTLTARRAKVRGLVQSLDLAVTNHLGNVLTDGYSVAWSQVSGASVSFSSTTTEDTSVTFPVAGNYRLRLIATVGTYVVTEVYDFEVSTATVSPVVNGIVNQPVSRITSPGGTAVFSVSTTGDGPFLYEWRLNGVAYWGASPSSQLSLANISTGMAGSYQCTIHTPTGSLLSNTATLALTSTATVTAGGLRREVWNGVGGNAVGDLTSRLTYPQLPDVTQTLTSAETPQSYGDSYGQRLTGWIIPPTTGQYKFYIAADDGSELWLSTTNSPANKVLIASKSGYTSYRNYSGGGQSALINLTAGQRYYVEILHKEGSGGDHLSVAWKAPGAAIPADGSAPIDGAYLESIVDAPSSAYAGLASWWKMDSASGNSAIDDFGSNDGAISGATWVVGKKLGALSFDGNDSVTCTAIAALKDATAFSALAWVKVNSGNNQEGIIVQQRSTNGYNGQYQLKVSATGKISFYVYGGGAQQFDFSGTTSINDGLWHHVAGVRDAAGSAFIYVDGVLNGSVTGTTVRNLDPSIHIGIGADIRDSIKYFRGSIDEVRVYSRALAQTEIADFFAEPSNTPPAFISDPMTGAGATEDSAYSASLGGFAMDANAGEILTFSKISGPPWLGVASNGILTGTPGDGDVGTASFTIRVTDRFGRFNEAVLNIPVTAVNDAPLFSADPLATANATHDVAYSATLAGSATDVDAGDTLSFSKISGPAWLGVASNGDLTGTPVGADLGTNQFVIRVTDAGGLSDDATLNVAVVLANPAGDSDGDGFTDALEVALGTNFQNAGSQPDAIYSGLRAWWKFNETSGTLAKDTTGRPQDGSVNGGATWSTGIDGGALAFDGVNDGVLVGTPAALIGTTDLTLSAWVKIAPGSAGGVIVQQRDSTPTGYNGEYVLIVKANGTVEFFIYRDGFQFDMITTATVNDGQWHRVTATRVGAVGAIYINGTQAATGSGAIKSLLSLGVAIGYDSRDSINYFNGSIDDVRVYSRALNALEIDTLGGNAAPIFTSNLISNGSTPAGNAYVGGIGSHVTDPNLGDTHTFSKTSGPAWLTVADDGVLSGTPGLGDGGTNNFEVRVTDGGGMFAQTTLTITVTLTPMQTWQVAQFGANASNLLIAGDGADPDGDNLENLLEYALGTNPKTPNTSGITHDMATGFLRLTVNKNTAATDVSFTVETCGDFSTWSSATTLVETNTVSQLIVRDTVTGLRRFIHLKVTR